MKGFVASILTGADFAGTSEGGTDGAETATVRGTDDAEAATDCDGGVSTPPAHGGVGAVNSFALSAGGQALMGSGALGGGRVGGGTCGTARSVTTAFPFAAASA